MHLRSEPEPVQHSMGAQTAAALQGMSDRLTLLEAHLGETSGEFVCPRPCNVLSSEVTARFH